MKHKKVLYGVLAGWLLATVLPPGQVIAKLRPKRS